MFKMKSKSEKTETKEEKKPVIKLKDEKSNPNLPKKITSAKSKK